MSGHPLNEQQRAVVDRLEGDVFVDAGAGSGKTRVLAERFAALALGLGRVDALRRILLVTFTEKAAAQLGERVRRVLLRSGHPGLARATDEAWISTIDSLFARIVRRYALESRVDPAFGMLVEPERERVRREAFDEAAEPLLAAGGVAALLDTFGVAQVRSAVFEVADRSRAMGHGVDELRPAGRGDPGTSAAGRLEAIAARLAPAADTATGRRNMERALELADALRSADARSPDGVSAALEVVRETGFRRGMTKPFDDLDPLVDEAKAVIGEARASLTSSLVRPHEEAFIELIRAFDDRYRARKAAAGVLDFTDVSVLAAAVMEDEAAAAHVAGSFDAVMVDEFQDTNDLQMRVIGSIARGALCAVGDERQSIYRFRYADVAVFRRERERVCFHAVGAKMPLALNYRSHGQLIETFNAMFGAVPFWPGDHLPLTPGREGGWIVEWPQGSPRVEVLVVDKNGETRDVSCAREAAALGRRLKAMVDDGVARPGDMVVLLRAGTHAATYARGIEAAGLTVHRTAGAGFYAAPEVAAARSLLGAVVNPRDDAAVATLLASVLGGVSDDGLCLLRAASPRGRLWDALASVEAAGLSRDDADRAGHVRDVVTEARRAAGRMRVADLLLEHCARLGVQSGGPEDSAWADLRKFARLAATFERTTPGDAGAFLRYVADLEEHGDREPVSPVRGGEDSVRIMTIHQAKGLEFPVVAVADLGREPLRGAPAFVVAREEGRPVIAAKAPPNRGLPRPEAYARLMGVEEDEDLAEEKRVFYVACTRAEEALILSGATDLGKGPADAVPMDWVRVALGPSALHGGEPAVPGVKVDVVGAAQPPEAPAAPVERASGALRAESPWDPMARERRPHAAEAPPEWSYSALVVYDRCPYRFYAERVLGLRGAAIGEGSSGALDLGDAVHAALRLAAEGALDQGRIDALSRYHDLSDEHASRLREVCEAFASSSVAGLVRRSDAFEPEARFAVGLSKGSLAGAMDLVVRDGDATTVVDYKTGRTPLDAAEARARHERQAQCYALAALEDGAPHVDVVFVEVERGWRETRFSYGAADRVELSGLLEALVAKVADPVFERLDGYDEAACADCPVSGSLCPVVAPGPRGDGRAGRKAGR